MYTLLYNNDDTDQFYYEILLWNKQNKASHNASYINQIITLMNLLTSVYYLFNRLVNVYITYANLDVLLTGVMT